MLELKESDIRAIAQSRYTAKVGKWFWIIPWALMAAVVVLTLIEPVKYCAIAPLVCFFALMVSYVIGQARFAKAMVADWRKETGQEKPLG